MTIHHERVVIDSNNWIYGLRHHPEHPACARLLDRLARLQVVLPRQIIKELQANLTESEMGALFDLVKQLPVPIDVRWEKAPLELVRKYRKLGCRPGDAAVAAHLEALGVAVLVTENRRFLKDVKYLPFRKLNAADVLAEMD